MVVQVKDGGSCVCERKGGSCVGAWNICNLVGEERKITKKIFLEYDINNAENKRFKT